MLVGLAVVDRQAWVGEEESQALPVLQGVADRPSYGDDVVAFETNSSLGAPGDS